MSFLKNALRSLLVVVLMFGSGLGLASAASATTGETKEVSWVLAVGSTASNPWSGGAQTLLTGDRDVCVAIIVQKDTYKYDSEHKGQVDALIKAGKLNQGDDSGLLAYEATAPAQPWKFVTLDVNSDLCAPLELPPVPGLQEKCGTADDGFTGYANGDGFVAEVSGSSDNPLGQLLQYVANGNKHFNVEQANAKYGSLPYYDGATPERITFFHIFTDEVCPVVTPPTTTPPTTTPPVVTPPTTTPPVVTPPTTTPVVTPPKVVPPVKQSVVTTPKPTRTAAPAGKTDFGDHVTNQQGQGSLPGLLIAGLLAVVLICAGGAYKLHLQRSGH